MPMLMPASSISFSMSVSDLARTDGGMSMPILAVTPVGFSTCLRNSSYMGRHRASMIMRFLLPEPENRAPSGHQETGGAPVVSQAEQLGGVVVEGTLKRLVFQTAFVPVLYALGKAAYGIA